MTFTSGTLLGPYEILLGLGAGDMGEDYRVYTGLARDVAIEVLQIRGSRTVSAA